MQTGLACVCVCVCVYTGAHGRMCHRYLSICVVLFCDSLHAARLGRSHGLGWPRYMWLRISLQGDGPLLARTPRPGLPKRQCKRSTCADALYMRLVAILTPLTSCCSSHPHPPGYAAVTSLLLCCAYRSTHQHTSICKHLLMCGYHTTQPLLPCSTVQLPAMHTLT